MECKTSFLKQRYAADQEVKVQVFLCSNAPLPLRLHKLVIIFTDQVSWLQLLSVSQHYHRPQVNSSHCMCIIIYTNVRGVKIGSRLQRILCATENLVCYRESCVLQRILCATENLVCCRNTIPPANLKTNLC